ncbi:hypothetical protein [Sphingobacterium deserti]|uniref:6-phosphogluconate dehydrogenase n=1 Tax=Sphingobacterium deserti TaxID=1229276 RepID=A0A0B8T6G3_9SPHI|nr:hypothetical protein [Sphingobacterium deserti]KGE12790.1 hypothetical protein DI53_3529 [Sphingobacterium deserti]
MATTYDATNKKSGTFKKVLGWIIVVLLLCAGGYVYYRYYFVFGEGVKSGYLNYAVKKGNVFKTYEGKLIQEGFGSSKVGTGISSNEFEFSIVSDSIFNVLEVNSGKYFDLHYKEYHGILPWRGNTRYVVDKVVNMK